MPADKQNRNFTCPFRKNVILSLEIVRSNKQLQQSVVTLPCWSLGKPEYSSTENMTEFKLSSSERETSFQLLTVGSHSFCQNLQEQIFEIDKYACSIPHPYSTLVP